MPKLPPSSEARPCLEDASALIDLTQRELRSLSYLLHPPLLDELGLPKALGNYVAGFAARSGGVKTVEAHRAAIMRKIGAKSIVRYAVRNQIIEF